ncbi:sterile alpha motif domain-containing protein 3-like [Ciona intestinalis]
MVTPDTSTSIPLDVSSTSTDTDEQNNDDHVWIFTYNIPNFPDHILEAINTKCLDSKTRKKIAYDVFNSVMLHTLYPTSHEYRAVCTALIKKHPNLADKNKFNRIGTWVESLRQRFRDLRRSLINNDQVRKMKKIYGFKRRNPAEEPSTSNEITTTPAKRPLLDTVQDTFEDSQSYKCHIKVIRDESRKLTNANISILLDRMNRTYTERRRKIQNGESTLEEILHEFPAFQFSAIILNEANKVIRKDVKSTFLKNMSMLEKIRKVLMTKKITPEAAKNVYHKDAAHALLCLPALVREKDDNFLFSHMTGSDDITSTPYPSIFIDTDEQPLIYLHRTKLCTAEDLKEAVLLVFCCYWVFDLVIPKNIKKTIELIGFLAADTKVQTNSVQNVINLFC